MASVEELIAQVGQAVARVQAARAHLETAAQQASEGRDVLGEVTAGTGYDPVLTEGVGGLTEAASNLVAIAGWLDAATAQRDAYTARIGPGATADPAPAAPPARRAAPSQVDRMRADLPPPVQPQTGQKTHGQWVTPGGTPARLVSGRDELAARVDQVIQDEGCPMRPVTASADVELKLAAHMRDQGITSATLLINNQPCEGPLSCDELVPVVLPPGAKLTVHGPDGFTKTYEGGKTPWWK